MTMRMFSPIADRVNQVLQDFLTAELALIDAEEGGLATPTIPSANYHEYLRLVVTAFPAIRTVVTGATPIETRADGFGQRLDAQYHVDVHVDATLDTAVDNELVLQRWVQRYTAGIFRVLTIFKDGLQTTADPVRFAEIVTPNGDVTIGPQAQQEVGITRGGVVPVNVRRREARV